MTGTLSKGDKVTYVPGYGDPERGIVKSMSGDEHAFVVYHCGGNWNEFEKYTGARTRLKDLKRGWSHAYGNE